MKLKASKAFRIGNQTYARGADVTVSDPVAKDLIAGGMANEIKAAKPAAKKDEKKDA